MSPALQFLTSLPVHANVEGPPPDGSLSSAACRHSNGSSSSGAMLCGWSLLRALSDSGSTADRGCPAALVSVATRRRHRPAATGALWGSVDVPVFSIPAPSPLQARPEIASPLRRALDSGAALFPLAPPRPSANWKTGWALGLQEAKTITQVWRAPMLRATLFKALPIRRRL